MRAVHTGAGGAGVVRFVPHGGLRLLSGRTIQDAFTLRRFAAISTNPATTSNTVDGSGIDVPLSEKAALNVGGVAPPTISVPTRSQSGSRLPSRTQACKSVTPAGNGVVPAPLMGLDADSQ